MENTSFCLMNCTVRWKAMLLQCLRKKVKQILLNDQKLSSYSTKLHKLPQFWAGKGRATVQMGSTVLISSLPLFKPVKTIHISIIILVLNHVSWDSVRAAEFWSLFADSFLKVNFENAEEQNCVTCLWDFSTWRIGRPI